MDNKYLQNTTKQGVNKLRLKTITHSKDSELLFVTESIIDNKGVFALKDIPAGAKVIEYKGERITKDVSEERLERDCNNGRMYIFELDSEFDVDGLSGGSDAIYINHSCEPNCEVLIEDGRIWYVALREIKQSEEIFIDYKFDCDDGTLLHPCRCGSKSCRGYIVDSEQMHILKDIIEKKEKEQNACNCNHSKVFSSEPATI